MASVYDLLAKELVVNGQKVTAEQAKQIVTDGCLTINVTTTNGAEYFIGYSVQDSGHQYPLRIYTNTSKFPQYNRAYNELVDTIYLYTNESKKVKKLGSSNNKLYNQISVIKYDKVYKNSNNNHGIMGNRASTVNPAYEWKESGNAVLVVFTGTTKISNAYNMKVTYSVSGKYASAGFSFSSTAQSPTRPVENIEQQGQIGGRSYNSNGEGNITLDPSDGSGDSGGGDSGSSSEETVNNQPKLTTTAEDMYEDGFDASFYSEEDKYYNDLYWYKDKSYSAKSFNSITGMPIQFMGNTDMRYGSSTFGKAFTKNILYDAPIAVIQPGAPQLGSSSILESESEHFNKLLKTIMTTYSIANNIVEAAKEVIVEGEAGDGVEAVKDMGKNALTDWLVGSDNDSYARFYDFESQYARYIQYVNTLCHLFATFLGIGNDTIPGTSKVFNEYDDSIDEVEYLDNGLGLKMLYGNYPALFVYYQPDSSLSQSFSNQTQESSLASKLNEVSNYSKEMSFLAGGLGVAGKGVTVGAEVDEVGLFGLADTQFSFGGSNLIKRIFSRASEGVSTIIGGNNLSLPEIYQSSNMSGSEYTLHVKLVNPYGTPEGAFLFQMRQLARLLSVSLPRQYGPNGYTSPFIIRAFSKGQFNVQLGIVESLVINRGGSGGENQTVHDIPMELDVTMTIKDLYQEIAISNEYTSPYTLNIVKPNLKQIKLLFNNVGLLDFVASYAGFNMNQPAIDMKFEYLINSLHRNMEEGIQFNGSINPANWKFPKWQRAKIDAFQNAVEQKTTWLAH